MKAGSVKKILIIQTAFLGDVILTLPLVQALKRTAPDSEIDFIAIPETEEIVGNHPDISNVIVYDKHGNQRSLSSFLSFRRRLRAANYDVVLSPHRSMRSCLLAKSTHARTRVGFDNSALKHCFTDLLPWRFGAHEIERNLSLLQPLAGSGTVLDKGRASRSFPQISISEPHRSEAERFLSDHKVKKPYAVVAPGTVWETKRYPAEMMVEVVRKLSERFANVVVIGGGKDVDLIHDFDALDEKVSLAIGVMPIMSSAEIIRESSLLVANDSAPIHIASAFNVPTVAIFGPTVKDFGFYPYHDRSVVIEINGLGCRPCSIHGGTRCPIVTFKCMRGISPDEIVEKSLQISGMDPE
jgi:heptosyltransferase-2